MATSSEELMKASNASKKSMENTGENNKEEIVEECTCPECNYRGPKDEFMTEENMEDGNKKPGMEVEIKMGKLMSPREAVESALEEKK